MPLNPSGPLTQYRTQIDLNEANIAQNAADIGNLTHIETQVIRGASYVDQTPTALDTPVQISFGVSQSTPEINLDAAGNFTILQSDEYNVLLRLVFGRDSNPGTALMYARALLNGVQFLDSFHAKIATADTEVPSTFEGTAALTAGDVVSFEMMRSSVGANNGGIYSEPSPLAGWAASPSCVCLFQKSSIQIGA